MGWFGTFCCSTITYIKASGLARIISLEGKTGFNLGDGVKRVTSVEGN